jgi:hypothetical protein
VFAIWYAKNLPQGDYTRYKEIGIETRDDQIREVRPQVREVMSDQRRWTSQVASSGRSDVRVIVVTGIVIVNELSNKTASSKPQPINYLSRIPGHVTLCPALSFEKYDHPVYNDN